MDRKVARRRGKQMCSQDNETGNQKKLEQTKKGILL